MTHRVPTFRSISVRKRNNFKFLNWPTRPFLSSKMSLLKHGAEHPTSVATHLASEKVSATPKPMFPEDEWTTYTLHIMAIWWLSMPVTPPEHRGRGLGLRLKSPVENFCMVAKGPRCCWLVGGGGALCFFGRFMRKTINRRNLLVLSRE